MQWQSSNSSFLIVLLLSISFSVLLRGFQHWLNYLHISSNLLHLHLFLLFVLGSHHPLFNLRLSFGIKFSLRQILRIIETSWNKCVTSARNFEGRLPVSLPSVYPPRKSTLYQRADLRGKIHWTIRLCHFLVKFCSKSWWLRSNSVRKEKKISGNLSQNFEDENL